MSASRLSRYRAERLLRKDFAGLRSKVLAVVRSRLQATGVVLDPSDLEACYAQAWQGLYATVLAGETVESPSAWLVLVTFRRAIDESRSASRLKGALESGAEGAFERHIGASDPDLAAQLDDRVRLRQVFEGLRASLSERECEAASLCYLQGLSRAEAAARMGIREARMRKLMEGASGRPGVASKVGGLLDTIRAGGWCEQQSSLMRAFAFGVLDPEGERHALAVAHCRECPACRAHVASLRGLASVLPLPLLSPLALAGAGEGAHGAGGSLSAGLGSSLSAKLAVTALVLLGGGYAVLDSRAHGSPGGPAGRAPAGGFAGRALAQPPLSSEPLARAFSSPFRSRPRSSRSPGRSAAVSARSSHTARSARAASSGEFSPERVPRERPVVSQAATLAPPRPQSDTSRAAGEFGIE
jgi:DNA-directed RNA polymerase specialized sigma24 family protein